jgi:hypothetical protein
MISERLALLKTSATEFFPVTRMSGGMKGARGVEKNFRYILSQQGGNGIPNLLGNLDLGSQKDEAIWK